MVTQPSSTSLTIRDFFDEQYKRYRRYWWRGENRYSLHPQDHVPFHAAALTLLKRQKRGRALDLGAGEGSDAIRLALLGYEVDAVEFSPVAAEKIDRFARQLGVSVRIHNVDATKFAFVHQYDVIICNGLLHYVADKVPLLRRMSEATVPGGLHVVSLFSTHTALPDCHRVVPVYADEEQGVVAGHYAGWKTQFLALERDKPEAAHPGFEPHQHSFVKIIARKG